MANISIKALIEAGVHFGHSTSRWNPQMEKYIYGKRNSIHIIDLRETIKGLLNACSFLQKTAGRGGEVIFVGTKKAARQAMKTEAQRAGVHWATERWLGGTFTNFETIKSRLKRLELLEELESTGKINNYSKKVISRYAREKRKLLRNLEGIRHMTRLPDCIVVIDPRREKSAIAEARRLGIPVIALTDTDSSPQNIDIVIPGNDDAFRSIRYVMSVLTNTLLEGKAKRSPLPQKKSAASEQAAPAPAQPEMEANAETSGVAAALSVSETKESDSSQGS